MRDLPSKIWGNFKNLLFDIWDSIKNIPTWIYDKFSEVIEKTKEFFINVWDFLTNFFENFKEFLITIFVPEDDYFSNQFDEIKNNFGNKFGDIENPIDRIKNIGSENIEDIEGNIKIGNVSVEGKIIDFSYLSDNIFVFQDIIRGFVWVFLALFNINKIYFLIRGEKIFNSSSGGE